VTYLESFLIYMGTQTTKGFTDDGGLRDADA
jgi:hypothetical protein